MTLKQRVEELEIHHVNKALAEANYHTRSAATALGLSHQGLLNKLERYKIPLPKISNAHTMRCQSCGYKIRVKK